MGLVLNPDIRLRKNKGRVIAYQYNDLLDVEGITPLHPAYAVLLSLFNAIKIMTRSLKIFFTS